MTVRVSIMVCTASLLVTYPVMAQANRHGHGHGHHGNGSDHSGHNGSDHSGDNDSDRSGHNDNGDDNGDDDDQGNNGQGEDNLVLATPQITSAVANAARSVTADLGSRSLRTQSGALIPTSAQARTYSVMTSDPMMSESVAQISAALSTAGPEARMIVPALVRSISRLGSNPGRLPTAVSRYNRFTRAASREFLSNPPPEFVALHTVLARLTSAASNTKELATTH